MDNAPTREIGYAQTPLMSVGGHNIQWWMYDDETTPELRWPQSIWVFDQMRRTDAQVKSVLRAVTLPVCRTPWRIDPAGARPEVVQLVAEDLGLPIVGEELKQLPRARDRFSWLEHLREALLMLPFGHMYFEQNVRIVDGKARLRKLAARMPKTIEEIDVARDGGLVSITQYGLGGGDKQPSIPVSRLVAYVHEKEAGNWLGHALALDTPVPTPDGWRCMGELQPGDRVFDENGAVCAVTAVRRWTDRPCFRVQFDDGEEIVADENHQWLSHVRVGQKRRPRIVTTAEMATTLRKYGEVNHAVPLAGALDLPDIELPVDPYVLGAWLGDGSLDAAGARICDAEGDVVAEISRRGYGAHQPPSREKARSWNVKGLVTGLRAAGIVTGSNRARTMAANKHVPAAYLRASAGQRLDLLRGLMDTDGHFDATNGQCIFSNTNKALADAVVELANSLGAKTKVQYVRQAGSVGYLKSGQAIHSRKDIYRVKFTARFIAFNMERKAKLQDLERAALRPYHYVRSVEIESNQDTVCIEVDSPSHLYLCGTGFKITHNSLLRPAYKNWLLKDRLLRVWAQTIERNGMGIPVYTAAPTEKDLATGLGLATTLRSGEAAGAAIPAEAILKLMGVEGQLPDAEPAVRYHDEQLARAVLAHFLNLGTQTGSWALGSTFADFFTLSLQTLARQIADVATQHVVEDLVDWNWGENEPAPKIVFDEIGSRQAATAEAIGLLIDKGVLTADDVLETSLRQQYGLPPADPDTARTPPAQQGTAPRTAPETQPDERPGSVAASAEVTAKFNPGQPRDPGGEDGGQWVKAPGGGAGPLDKLKLGGRAPAGFSVRSSKKLKTDYADVGIAEVDGPDGPHFRVGVIGNESGKWDAGFVGEARKAQLRQEIDRKQALMDSDDDDVDDDIEDQISELQSELEDLEGERTAVVSPSQMADFRRQLDEALMVAKANKAKVDADAKAQDAIDEKRAAIIAEFSDAEMERGIHELSWRLRQAQGIVRDLENDLASGRSRHGWDPEFTAERLASWKANVVEYEAELAPLLARRAELMPPDARVRLEDLDRQYAAINDPDIDDMLTAAEVSAPNGARIRAEIWGSDDEDEGWTNTRLYVLAPGETADDADHGDAYAYFRGLKGLGKLIAGLGEAGSVSASQSLARSDPGRWVQAHLPGLHPQDRHGRRFRTPGDRSSGLRPNRTEREATQRAQEFGELKESLSRAAAAFAARSDRQAGAGAKSTSTPTRMTKGAYTKILKAEQIRLHMLDGKTEKEAKALARPQASIDDLKARNTELRKALRRKGVDYRTDEQKRADDTEKNTLLDEVEQLASAGGHDGPAKRAAASKMSKTELRKFVADVKDYQRRQKAKADAPSRAAFQAVEDKSLATPRQVGYIVSLLRERAKSGEGGGFMVGPTETAEIRKMSKRDASAYINSLRGDY